MASAVLQVSPVTLPEPVAESLLDVGDVVVRRQDTSHARVQVVKPLVGDTHILDSFDLLPGTLGGERVLQTPETSPTSEL